MGWVWVEDGEDLEWAQWPDGYSPVVASEGQGSSWARDAVRDVVVTLAAEAARVAFELLAERLAARRRGGA